MTILVDTIWYSLKLILINYFNIKILIYSLKKNIDLFQYQKITSLEIFVFKIYEIYLYEKQAEYEK